VVHRAHQGGPALSDLGCPGSRGVTRGTASARPTARRPELHAARVSPQEIESRARLLLAQARGHQLAEARKQLGLGQRETAEVMGVSVARISQIGHGEVTSFEVIARYVEALGGSSIGRSAKYEQ
jgi:ribosome-binding protein aMBF1 (putative translation factor)